MDITNTQRREAKEKRSAATTAAATAAPAAAADDAAVPATETTPYTATTHPGNFAASAGKDDEKEGQNSEEERAVHPGNAHQDDNKDEQTESSVARDILWEPASMSDVTKVSIAQFVRTELTKNSNNATTPPERLLSLALPTTPRSTGPLEDEFEQVNFDTARRKPSAAEEAAASPLSGPRAGSWWTGCQPGDVPGMRPNGQISSLPQLLLKDCTKQALQEYFDNTWFLTESLFAGLQGDEPFMRTPAHGLRYPLVFYYGHAATFYVNKLRAAGIVQAPINPLFETLLEAGVDEMSWDVVDDDMKWPSVWEVHAYRRDVYSLVSEVITSAPDDAIAIINMDSPYWALAMAFEHERIHMETSSVLIRELPLEHVAHPATWPEAHSSGSGDAVCTSLIDNPLLHVEAGSVALGKPKAFPSYGWDNEYGSREFSVPPFEATKHMVSNGEYVEFVKDAGYARQELWTEEGWRWKMCKNVKYPHFWIPEGPSGFHKYSLRTIFDEVPLPWDWPVLVNVYEAKAFASWKTYRDDQTMGDQGKAYRLATELEYHLMRGANSTQLSTNRPEIVDPVLSASGCNPFDRVANTNLTSGSESAVDAFPPNDMGFHDVVGNAWEWCEDYVSALDGFVTSPLYEDFSTPSFDGEHHVISGGSFASTGNAASVFARSHFRPHFHQHAGFRLVAPKRREEVETFMTSCTDAPPPFVGSYPYRISDKGAPGGGVTRQEKAERSVAASLAMHFAVPEIANQDATVLQGLHYPKRCAQVVLRALKGVRPAGVLEVLEVGCGAGGGSFELSKGVGKVVAMDASESLINAASAMARNGSMTVDCPSVRGSSAAQEVFLDTETNPARITFRQCDPMCLPAGLTEIDAVLIHSVIDAIPRPKGLLARMGGAQGVVREDGGLVVVVSAYDWNEEVTPRGRWLGGYPDDNGKQVPSMQGISTGLGKEFKLIHVERVPCIRPLTDRTFEYASTEATVWRRD